MCLLIFLVIMSITTATINAKWLFYWAIIATVLVPVVNYPVDRLTRTTSKIKN